VRRLVDCLIAAVAIRERATLLHNDRDFSVLARQRHSKLRIEPCTIDADCRIRFDQISYPTMKTLSVTEVARNFSAVLDSVERDQEEIVLVRNRRQVARLVPEASRQDALEVFGDLYRTLDDETAEALSAAVSANRRNRKGRVSELKNPWAG
jgi:prevent-host-death family protein